MQVFVHGGSWSGGVMDRDAEVFDPNADDPEWRFLTSISTASIETDDQAGQYRSDNHGWFMGWSDNTGALLAVRVCFVCHGLPASACMRHQVLALQLLLSPWWCCTACRHYAGARTAQHHSAR